jgi:hypothetical protein
LANWLHQTPAGFSSTLMRRILQHMPQSPHDLVGGKTKSPLSLSVKPALIGETYISPAFDGVKLDPPPCSAAETGEGPG